MALFRHTPRVYSCPHYSHIFFILHLVQAWYRSVKCKLEYNTRFLKKQHIRTGGMLDFVPSVPSVVLPINFKLRMFYIVIFQSMQCHKVQQDIHCFEKFGIIGIIYKLYKVKSRRQIRKYYNMNISIAKSNVFAFKLLVVCSRISYWVSCY